MRLSHEVLDTHLEWSAENNLCELIVESPTLLRSILRELSVDSPGEKLHLFDGDKEFSFSSTINLVSNPCKLEFNSRKVVTNLLKAMAQASMSEDFYLSTNKFKTEIIRYLSEISDSENYGFEIETDDFSLDQIAKAVNLHVVGDEDDFVELLTDYAEVMVELGQVKLIVFINLRDYLNDDEFSRLIENFKNRQINALLLESNEHNRIGDHQRLTIDKDLCEI